MAAGQHDIIIDKGATFKMTLTVKEGGAVKNLSSYSIRGKLKSSMQITAGSFGFDFTDTTADNKNNGTIQMKLAHNVQNGLNGYLDPGTYFYDVEIFTGSEGSETEVTRLIQGKATVRDEVTS
jgi:cell division protein YceG involved in septum cleavage